MTMTIPEAHKGIMDYFTDPTTPKMIAKDSECVYLRPSDKSRCAVGCLVPMEILERMDEDFMQAAISCTSYEKETDPGDIRDILWQYFGIDSIDDKLCLFLNECQTEHDRTDTVEEFLHEMRILGLSHNIPMEELNDSTGTPPARPCTDERRTTIEGSSSDEWGECSSGAESNGALVYATGKA